SKDTRAKSQEPRAKSQDPRANSQQPRAKSQRPSECNNVPVRILLVEDEPDLVRAMRKGLTENSYAVDVATNGRDALERATTNPYDAIVLDVMIPPPDGFEVCRRLRAGGITAPILMLTARDAVDDRVRGLDSGADDYLVKPFEFAELLARLRALIRRGGAKQMPVIEV